MKTLKSDLIKRIEYNNSYIFGYKYCGKVNQQVNWQNMTDELMHTMVDDVDSYADIQEVKISDADVQEIIENCPLDNTDFSDCTAWQYTDENGDVGKLLFFN